MSRSAAGFDFGVGHRVVPPSRLRDSRWFASVYLKPKPDRGTGKRPDGVGRISTISSGNAMRRMQKLPGFGHQDEHVHCAPSREGSYPSIMYPSILTLQDRHAVVPGRSIPLALLLFHPSLLWISVRTDRCAYPSPRERQPGASESPTAQMIVQSVRVSCFRLTDSSLLRMVLAPTRR